MFLSNGWSWLLKRQELQIRITPKSFLWRLKKHTKTLEHEVSNHRSLHLSQNNLLDLQSLIEPYNPARAHQHRDADRTIAKKHKNPLALDFLPYWPVE